MTDTEYETIVNLVVDRLGPQLMDECKRIEGEMSASHVAFQLEIRRDVEHHHSENRLRFQNQDLVLENMQASNARIEAHAIANGNETRELADEVREWAGKRKGVEETEALFARRDAATVERRGTWLKWLGGLLLSSGAIKWVYDLFHPGK